MEKDFDEWNSKKKQLDVVSRKLLFKEGEIWWCSIGVNVGEEVYGKGEYFRRPVVILRKLSGNTCIVMPTTTRERSGSWYHHLNIRNKDRWVMMNQIRLISANRLWVRESTLSREEFEELKKSVAGLLGL
ncbi:MAG: type II toxin-antitoxin system PemK/MazF family toxin [Candidatus Moranbacteria bacterium]|nr:type II toxin-antitoxin system PemK/MazF family toxin [Candidatus Moranbacteria bacterium]